MHEDFLSELPAESAARPWWQFEKISREEGLGLAREI